VGDSLRVEKCGCTFRNGVISSVCGLHERDHALNWREIARCPVCIRWRKPCKDHVLPGNEHLVPGRREHE
jgi:hypothetical protein